MNSRSLGAIVALLAVALLAPTASGQSRLTLEVGPLFPVGNFADTHDTSIYFGGRWEYQDVNALGEAANLGYYLRGGYGVLQLDGELKQQLDDLGQSTSSSYIEAGAGVRVYSTQLPFFVSVGAGYANFDAGGDADSKSGFGASLGLGLSKDLGGFFLEVEGRGHFVVIDPKNLEFFTVTAGLGLPF